MLRVWSLTSYLENSTAVHVVPPGSNECIGFMSADICMRNVKGIGRCLARSLEAIVEATLVTSLIESVKVLNDRGWWWYPSMCVSKFL